MIFIVISFVGVRFRFDFLFDEGELNIFLLARLCRGSHEITQQLIGGYKRISEALLGTPEAMLMIMSYLLRHTVSVIKPQKSLVQVIVQRKGIPNAMRSRVANFHSPDPESHVPRIGQVISEAVIFQKALKRVISHEVYLLKE